MQDQKPAMRPWFAASVVLVLAASLLAVREYQVSRQIALLRAERQQWVEQAEVFKTRIQQAEAKVEEAEERFLRQPIQPGSTRENPLLQQRIATLESQIQEMQTGATVQRQLGAPTPPQYDPTNPQLSSPQPHSGPPTNSVVLRNWGQEQALGAPNTERSGDLPTAWASRDPDGGAEWLAVGFDSAVDVAEVRIRETFNPGAINRVTALQDGREVVLWEGTAEGGVAPRDFVVPVAGNIRAGSIVIHLDSARVSGWNEIDAVELVGRDGSRQWATSANASSTYAEPRSLESPPATGVRRLTRD